MYFLNFSLSLQSHSFLITLYKQYLIKKRNFEDMKKKSILMKENLQFL